MEDFIKKNYKNPEGVIELYHSEHSKLENNFFKKYPLADIDKFSFQVDINRDGILESSRVFLSVDSISSFNVESKDFKNNPEYTKYLYSVVRPSIGLKFGAMEDLDQNLQDLDILKIRRSNVLTTNAMYQTIHNSKNMPI